MERQRIKIIAQILAFCTRAGRKTRIIYGTNFGNPQFKTYLTLLAWRDLLAHNLDRYVTTEKGHCFLEAFAWLNDVLEGHARRAFLETISESYKEAKITHVG